MMKKAVYPVLMMMGDNNKGNINKLYMNIINFFTSYNELLVRNC